MNSNQEEQFDVGGINSTTEDKEVEIAKINAEFKLQTVQVYLKLAATLIMGIIGVALIITGVINKDNLNTVMGYVLMRGGEIGFRSAGSLYLETKKEKV